MKRIISVSLGSSKRNATGSVVLNGEEYQISREGWDGDLNAMRARLQQLDGQIDAIGLGGCSRYLYGKNGKAYPLRAICKLADVVKHTPVLDGARIKDTLERDAIAAMPGWGIPLEGRRVLMVCGLERLGMSEALQQAGADLRFGDAMFALGLNFWIKKLSTLHRVMGILAPVVCRLPFKALYPSGESQNKQDNRFAAAYEWAEIIAGDYLYIRAHLPQDLTGKIIVTNTVTAEDTEQLRQRGLDVLITATPLIDGRSYGTNVIEALMTSAAGITDRPMTADEYRQQFALSGLKPRVEWLNRKTDSQG